MTYGEESRKLTERINALKAGALFGIIVVGAAALALTAGCTGEQAVWVGLAMLLPWGTAATAVCR
jgi:hypothetical protein